MPRTAKKVYLKKIDSDIDVYYILPTTGTYYTRIFFNKRVLQAYNNRNDYFPESYFKEHIRRSVRPVSVSTWDKVKASIKRK